MQFFLPGSLASYQGDSIIKFDGDLSSHMQSCVTKNIDV